MSDYRQFYRCCPPSTRITSPVMWRARGEQRKSTTSATSSGLASLPHTLRDNAFCTSSAGISRRAAVSTMPGATALTLTS